MASEWLISFPEASKDQASIWAGELSEALAAVDRDLSTERRRDDPHTLDFGTTLAVILAAPASVAFAKGLGENLARVIVDWLTRRRGADAKITITRPDGSTLVENISAEDAVELARELSQGIQQG